MRCRLCLSLSRQCICQKCLQTTLTPTPSQRILKNGLKVYSFYKYSEIAPLLHTKHTISGSDVFSILARHALLSFAKSFNFPVGVYAIPVDDRVDSGYSHSAVLAHELRSVFTPLYGVMRARNTQSYSGKTLAFREQNPRDFLLKCKSGLDVVLVDDIVTTGTTLMEAQRVLEKSEVNLLFALVLADAKEDF